MAGEIIDVNLNDKEGRIERQFLLEEFLENNKLTIGILLIGVILLGIGVLGFKIVDFGKNQPEVEILGSEIEDEKGETKIIVEVAGEVRKTGVYEMSFGSRVNDLLVLSGGMSANADREWVSKNINLALKLQDGAKIYIPSISQNSNLKPQNQTSDQKVNNLININTASAAELDTLWGIGEATARKIISSRPYQRTEEILEKKIVKSNVWEEIKDKITVY